MAKQCPFQNKECGSDCELFEQNNDLGISGAGGMCAIKAIRMELSTLNKKQGQQQ